MVKQARIKLDYEPRFENEMSQLELMKTLNWYHGNKENKDAINYINSYLKKNKLPGKVNTSGSYLTVGWLCRISSNGNKFDDNTKKTFQKLLNGIIIEDKTLVEDVVLTKVNVPTIQDRMREKIAEIAGDIEGAIDDYILSGFKDAQSPLSIMHDRAKGMHANRIAEIFKKRRNEFDEALTTNNEGYSNFKKTELKKIIAYCDKIILDAMQIAGESKQTRKPRKRKTKTPEQLVSKLQYCLESKEYSIKSITPKQIIGAIQLWVFNTKTRKIGVYHSLDAGGLSVKGSTITDFSETKSVAKILRKPQDGLKTVMNGGKIVLRKFLEEINAKESPLNGRINKDTILLRVS